MRLYRARPGGRHYYPELRRMAASLSGALAFLGAAALAFALAAVGELRPCWLSLGAFALLCAVLGACSRVAATPLIAGADWLVYNGFVVHRYATVAWTGTGLELARYGLFAAAALATALPAGLPRRKIRAEHWPPPGAGR
ncbi:hypothetical protein [Kitasatospora azatica]|uniref:hypothetical protein n=1 Tax=Kitasatospora azatica TaxID=58347 RepID=UPI0012F9881B|nr:hypothetical protein [Kitasatospora azatica]